MTDGEIRVREGGSVTAIETDALDEPISIDLDADQGPHVGVPGHSWVSYEGDDVEAWTEDVATDGGTVRDRVAMRQYGLGLTGDARQTAVAVMALAYAAAGYLFAISEGVSAVVTFAAAALATYVLLLRQTGGSDA